MGEQPILEQKEKAKMNLLTNFGATVSAMAEIEGSEWAEQQLKECQQAEQGKKVFTMMDVNIAGALKYIADIKKG